MIKQLVLVRGYFYTRAQTQEYELFPQNLSVRGYVLGNGLGRVDDVRIKTKRLWDPKSLGGSVPIWQGLIDRTVDALMGFEHMSGLRESLKEALIIDTMEEFHTYSHQAAQVAKKNNIPLVITSWETLKEKVKPRDLDVLDRARKCIARTKLAAKRLEGIGVSSGKIQQIYPGVAQELFRNKASKNERNKLRSQYKINNDTFVALYVGRFEKHKGVDDLIHALNIINRRDVVLALTGWGVEVENWRRLAEELDLAEQVLFIPPTSYDDLWQRYAMADCLVLPSRSTPIWEEQFGYVLVEAMLSELPIIATATGAIPEVLAGVGTLVQENSPEDIAKAIERYREDGGYRGRQGLLGLERAKTFDRKETAKALFELYNELL